MGGAYPKIHQILHCSIPVTAPGVLDPVNHPSQWILEEMDRSRAHPCWWKEIRASKKITMGSNPRRYTVWENLRESEALHYAQWQAVAFRLPLVQQEASGWWDAPPWLHGLCPQDFLPHTDASGTRDFCTVRQEKTLALAWVLPWCTERRGSDWSPLRCSTGTPEMHGPFNASQWGLHCRSLIPGPCRQGTWNLPTLEEEAILLVEELEMPEAPEAAASLLECLETPKPMEPTKQINTPTTPAPSSPTLNPAATLPGKQRNPSKGLRPTKVSQAVESGPTLRRTKGYPTGGENSGPFSTPGMSLSMTFKSKT